MSMFGKGGDLIDYTYLQKRGLIKKGAEEKSEKTIRTRDGFVDLSKAKLNLPPKEDPVELSPFDSFKDLQSNNSVNENPSTPALSENSGFVNLFDNPVLSSSAPILNSEANSIGNETLSSKDLNALKIKLEDLEFKLSNLIDKFVLVESKLTSFERKVLG